MTIDEHSEVPVSSSDNGGSFVAKLRADVEQGVQELAARAEGVRGLPEDARTIIALADAIGAAVPDALRAVADGRFPEGQAKAAPRKRGAAKKKPRAGTQGVAGSAAVTQAQILGLVRELAPVRAAVIRERMGISRQTAQSHLNALRDAGLIFSTQEGRRTLVWAPVEDNGGEGPAGAPDGGGDDEPAPAKRADPVPSAGTLGRVRDAARELEGEPITASLMMGRVRMPHRVAKAALRELGRQGILRELEPDCFVYERPRAPGRAAVEDMARRAVVARVERDVVAGTGKGIRVKDAEVRALLEDARSAGCEVGRASNGHFELRRGRRSVQVAATPSDHRSVKNDRSRARRVLGVSL